VYSTSTSCCNPHNGNVSTVGWRVYSLLLKLNWIQLYSFHTYDIERRRWRTFIHTNHQLGVQQQLQCVMWPYGISIILLYVLAGAIITWLMCNCWIINIYIKLRQLFLESCSWLVMTTQKSKQILNVCSMIRLHPSFFTGPSIEPDICTWDGVLMSILKSPLTNTI
jgi:hypothetical protein